MSNIQFWQFGPWIRLVCIPVFFCSFFFLFSSFLFFFWDSVSKALTLKASSADDKLMILISLWANSADDKMTIHVFFYFPRKQALAFHANCFPWRKFARNVKSYFLGKIRTRGPRSLTWLPEKFQVSWPFSSKEEVQYRFSRWRPCWISNHKNFSYFWSTCHHDTSNEVSSQLAFWFRIKNFKIDL